jgi:hypothetical protein
LEQIARVQAKFDIVGPQGDGAPIVLKRRAVLAEIAQHVAQIVVRPRIVGRQSDCGAICWHDRQAMSSLLDTA